MQRLVRVWGCLNQEKKREFQCEKNVSFFSPGSMIDAEEAGGRGTSVVLSDLPASEHTESLHEDCPFNKII